MNLSLPDFRTVHILIIGDVMLDRYWQGQSQRISPEAPVPIVHVQQQSERPGGAANVAVNITSLGAKATLMGVTGDDAAADSLQQLLEAKNVSCQFQRLANMPTITKLRILSRHQQLLRLDFEQSLSDFNCDEFIVNWQTAFQNSRVIVLSDYGKGALAQPQALIKAARQADKAVIVDPKGNDFSKYKHASLITPNLSEFEAVVGDCPDLASLEQKGNNLRQDLQLDALLITRSEQGMTLIRADQPPVHLPAHNHDVYDVTGAGDTVVSVLASSLSAGQDMLSATALANHAAGLVVTKSGAASVTVAELKSSLQPQLDGLLSLNELNQQRKQAKNRQQTVVMTNGCFDILHPGHIHYLNQARQLGDKLIVAVNDDASVKRLKGDTRPINTLADRMAVLAGLQAVDWVIPFSEDTPADLICQLNPDILVKGGDYQVSEIAGHECVLAQGGQVLTLDFVTSQSTTGLLERIKKQS